MIYKISNSFSFLICYVCSTLAHKTCPHCNEKIFGKNDLVKHVKKFHTTRPKVLHICAICKKEFKQKINLQQHQILHSKKANYENEMKKFWEKSGLNKGFLNIKK